MRFIRIPLFIIVFLVAVIFLVQNHQALSQSIAVKLDLLYNTKWEGPSLPIYFYLTISFIFGFFICLFFFLTDRIRMGHAFRKSQKTIKALQREINSLRTMPVTHVVEDGSTSADMPKVHEE